MPKHNGQEVKTRPLTKDDQKFGSQFQQGRDMVVVTYPDGREEVAEKSAVTG